MKQETSIYIGLIIMFVIFLAIGTFKPPAKSRIENNYYPASRIIAGIYVFMAYIVGILSIIAPISIIVTGYSNNNQLGINIENNYVFAFLVFLIGMIITLLLVATSERIKIFIDIEHNTRKIAENQKEKL